MSRRKKGHAEAPENHERWLVSYADFITLLMVFFVVMYSMSSADSQKFRQISASLQKAFNVDVMQGATNVGIMDSSSTAAVPVDDLIDDAEVPQVARLQSSIQAALNGGTQNPDVSVGVDREGVVIRLSGSYLFDSGRAELKPNSLGILDAIASELRPLANDIRVDGHTDSTPIDSPRYPTNWELSSARALAVTRYFGETSGIRAGRLMAAGFGEFRPIAPNDTREHRAQNRRVEIHLLSSAFVDPSATRTEDAVRTSGSTPSPSSASPTTPASTEQTHS
ncbi:MAG: flagellar motor protein MotB [Chloroflexota bacterium]